MSFFNFRLQSILDLRLHVEKEQKDLFAKETAKLNELLYANEIIENKHSVWSENYLKEAEVGISPVKASQLYSYLGDLQIQIKQNEALIENQKQVIERERMLLVDKMKDRKTIEVLKNKQYERFHIENQKQQEKEIEEIIINNKLKIG